jgi:hypothetical protein
MAAADGYNCAVRALLAMPAVTRRHALDMNAVCSAVDFSLLCRWLLLRREAGGIEQRQKHVNVLMYGEQQ